VQFILFSLSLINCEQEQPDCVNRPQKKDIQNHINLPWIRQEWLRLKQVPENSSESNRKRMLLDCQSWVIENTRTQHSPPVATVLVAAPSGWSYVVLLVKYLQNLHDCFVPLHCQCCIIIALRMFHVNLSFRLEANYNDWSMHEFIQSVHISD